MHVLMIIHDPPYGSEKPFEAIRLADALLKVESDLEITVYLTADGVLCAKAGQKTPDGYYNIERILKPILRRGSVMACRTCLEARGLAAEELMEGVLETRLGDLAQLTLEADKVLVY
ncbi:MAG: DsrE family protein [Phycisphaerales bacterium]|nr:MAG: DsrE family protein [Phycisphaerales bacterium]